MPSRSPKLFTLDADVIAALALASKERGEPMSRIVEQGIRLALALPPAEVSEDDERTLAPTRSEVAILQVLKAAGPGWHSTHDLMVPAGLTSGVCEKALRALALRGEAFRWGDAHEMFDGRMVSGWGTRPALEVIKGLCDRAAAGLALLPPGGSSARDRLTFGLIDLVRKLAPSIDEIDQVRALVSVAVDLPTTTLGIGNLRERLALANKRERERVEA